LVSGIPYGIRLLDGTGRDGEKTPCHQHANGHHCSSPQGRHEGGAESQMQVRSRGSAHRESTCGLQADECAGTSETTAGSVTTGGEW
jgi:hypothetical protein